ncbi:uncharacterized protein [Aristolochia californica]|uniref:uncharacterized protein n=1 Tax=Aristolochia californica TaxID=171875 RepID=UPI0035E01584
MRRLFLEKYFLASRVANIRKEIYGVRQHNGESLHEYWERFKRLCASCPHHQISEQLLIHYFYEGLLPTKSSMIDAANGGALVDKTPEAARNLIANMVANSQQFGTRLDLPSKNVNEVNISFLEQQIVSLTSLVRQMDVGNMQTVKTCGICLVVGHPTDMCPTLQEKPNEQVNVAGGFPGQPQRKYDPYSNTYNMGWRDHPNLSYGKPQVNQPATENHPSYQQYRQPYPLDNNRAKLPILATPASLGQEKERNVVTDRNIPNDDDIPKRKFPPLSNYKPVPPFPQALADSRKDEQNKDLYETFQRCEKLKGCEKVRVRENVSATIQRKLPTKCKDPVFELDGKDELEVAISKHIEKENEELALSSDLQEIFVALNDITQLQHSGNIHYIELPVSNERPLPSILQGPTPDLKPLPSHLKYMFLGNGGTLPMIISSKLSAPQY